MIYCQTLTAWLKDDVQKEKQLAKLEQQKKIKIHKWQYSISGFFLMVEWEISKEWMK